jgi:uncharacterized membrane protein YgcG
MGSTAYQPGAGNAAAIGATDARLNSQDPDKAVQSIVRGFSARQRHLNRLWAHYATKQYEDRLVDWDGSKHLDGIDLEQVVTAGYIPSGFYDAGQNLPLKFRRPSAPYHLVRCIVNRFTGLLISERNHPSLTCDGDPETEDWIGALATASRLWAALIQGRTYGGAMGSLALSFQFLDGKPIVNVHDPRWCTPTFNSLQSLDLRSLEIRYPYQSEERDPGTGKWVTRWLWYRRVIDEMTDTVYSPVEVDDHDDAEEPKWTIERMARPGFGFCPAVWVQNTPAEGQVDGDPDCDGIFDQSHEIDALLSQSAFAIISNLDPTVLIRTDGDVPPLQKGSNNMIKVPCNSDAKYLETSLAGAEAGVGLAKDIRTWALEVSQCVLDHPGQGAGMRTATEIERAYSSMLSKGDILREQYGQRGVLPLLEKMARAARMLGSVRIEEPSPVAEGAEPGVPKVVRYSLTLPPKVVKDEDGKVVSVELRVLGDGLGLPLDLTWPPYFEPGLLDRVQATTAAVQAKAGGVIDDESAARSVAPYFDIKDPLAMVRKLAKASADREESANSALFGGGGAGSGGFGSGGGRGGGGGRQGNSDEPY